MKIPFRHKPTLEEIGQSNFESCRVRETLPALEFQRSRDGNYVNVEITTSCPKLEDLGSTALSLSRRDYAENPRKTTDKVMDQTVAVFGKTICGGCDYAGMSGQLEVASYRREIAETKLAAAQANLEIQQLSTQLGELNP